MKKMDGWMDESLALLVATKGQGIGDLQLQEQRKGGREGGNCRRQAATAAAVEGRGGGSYLRTASLDHRKFFFSSLCSAEHDYTRQAKAHARLK